MANKFSSKAMMKNAKEAIVPQLAQGAGAVGAAYLSNKLWVDMWPSLDAKWHGPILFALGMGAQVLMPKNKYVKNVGQGVATYAILQSAGNFIMPDNKEALGLAGNYPQVDFPVVDYRETRIEEDGPMEGLEDEDDDDQTSLSEYMDQLRLQDPNQGTIKPGMAVYNPNTIVRGGNQNLPLNGNEDDDEEAAATVVFQN